MRRWPLAVALIAIASAASAQPVRPLDEVKAAYLLNFLRYAEWPGRPHTGPLVICVVGLEAVHAILEHTVKGEQVEGRQVEARLIQEPSSDCHVVFAPNGVNAGAYIRAAHDTLTVGESPAFLEQGGAISFVMIDSRLRFRINTEAAMRAGVRISSRLLRLSYDGGSATP
jgi:hypothetical protein